MVDHKLDVWRKSGDKKKCNRRRSSSGGGISGGSPSAFENVSGAGHFKYSTDAAAAAIESRYEAVFR